MGMCRVCTPKDMTAGPFGSHTWMLNVSVATSPSVSSAFHVYVRDAVTAVGVPAIVRVEAVHVMPCGIVVGVSV